MLRALLLLSLPLMGCEFDAFRDGLICSEDTPCASGVCVQGLCRDAPEMQVDAALDAAVDAGLVIDARVIDAQPPADAQPVIDMRPIIDAQPMVRDAEMDVAVVQHDMADPEPDPLPEPLPEPEPEDFGFVGVECGDAHHLCVLVAADATIRLHEPAYRSGELSGPVLNLERDNQYQERGDVLLGFFLRQARIADAVGLDLLVPRANEGRPYPVSASVAFVPTVWDEEDVDWNFGLAREQGMPTRGETRGEFTVFPLDTLLERAKEIDGRFSVELTLNEDGRFDYYSRETQEKPATRLRFRFRPE